jgi:hypothetical protein
MRVFACAFLHTAVAMRVFAGVQRRTSTPRVCALPHIHAAASKVTSTRACIENNAHMCALVHIHARANVRVVAHTRVRDVANNIYGYMHI